jgi:hypothetical protein
MPIPVGFFDLLLYGENPLFEDIDTTNPFFGRRRIGNVIGPRLLDILSCDTPLTRCALDGSRRLSVPLMICYHHSF